MVELAKIYPQYGFEKHKGYGTRLHEELLSIHHPSEVHRKTYAPVKKLLLI
jgi:ribonuclease HII